MDWKKLAFSWETKLVSLAGVVYAAVQGFNEPCLNAALHDGKLQMTVALAILAYLSKSNSAHGTADVPIPPAEAQQIAAVAASVPPASSYVGGAVPGTSDLFYSLPGDSTPVGAAVTVGGQKLIKIASAYYEKAN